MPIGHSRVALNDACDVDGLQSFAEDIWIANGPRVRFVVASLPTRMIVVKLGDGSLWINSPVTVSDETINQIETISRVRYLVAPTTSVLPNQPRDVHGAGLVGGLPGMLIKSRKRELIDLGVVHGNKNLTWLHRGGNERRCRNLGAS